MGAGTGVVHYTERLCAPPLLLAWAFNITHLVVAAVLCGWIVTKRDHTAMTLYRCVPDYWGATFAGLGVSFILNSIVVDPFFIAAFVVVSTAFVKRAARKTARKTAAKLARAVTQFLPTRASVGDVAGGPLQVQPKAAHSHGMLSVERM